jgi:hypothetical protein
MKNRLSYALSFCYLMISLVVFSPLLVSCAGSQGQASEQQGKKKKSKRCKMKSCHVRMVHMHEGTEMKGKRSWSLKACFYFGKNPKYGEGYKKDQRDPHQGKRN